MNMRIDDLRFKLGFLNGVCRPEPISGTTDVSTAFLNGVCRPEHLSAQKALEFLFLNGVCRHEHLFDMHEKSR